MNGKVRTTMLVATVVFGYGLIFASGAIAQKEEIKILAGDHEKPITDAAFIPEEFDIGVSGELFLRIRANAAGFTAAERARIVEARIVYALSYGDLDPNAVTIRPVRGAPTIYVGNIRVITVYPADVEAAGAASRHALAQAWAEQIRCCLRAVAPWSRIEAEQS